MVNDVSSRTPINHEEDSEDEHIPFELAGYHGYDSRSATLRTIDQNNINQSYEKYVMLRRVF